MTTTSGSKSGPTLGRTGRRATALIYGLVCHLCFGLGIAAMILGMFFGMTRALGTLVAPWSWIANGALLAQFPVLHSLLLSSRGRRVLSRLAPGGAGSTLAPTTFVTVAGLQLLALYVLWSPSGIVWWRAQGSALVVVTVLYLTAWLLLGWSMLSAGLGLQTGTIGWTALLAGRPPRYPPMPQTGLFRFIRQPIYVSFTLTLWTVSTWTPDQLVLAVVLSAYCVFAPVLKERRYRRIYGQQFEDYARRVPYWLPIRRVR